MRLAVSGVLTWAAAVGLAHLVGRPSPGEALAGVVLRDAPVNTLSYPALNAALATALATTAAPWVTRPWRRVAAVLVVLVWIAPVYLGASFPLDVVGGAALGWGIAAASGSAGRRPRLAAGPGRPARGAGGGRHAGDPAGEAGRSGRTGRKAPSSTAPARPAAGPS